MWRKTKVMILNDTEKIKVFAKEEKCTDLLQVE